MELIKRLTRWICPHLPRRIETERVDVYMKTNEIVYSNRCSLCGQRFTYIRHLKQITKND